MRPAGMVTLPFVLKKVDLLHFGRHAPKPGSYWGAISLLGAITGHAVSNNGIGAFSGLGVAILMFKYVNPYNELATRRP